MSATAALSIEQGLSKAATLSVLLISLGLAACGGGGGASTPTPSDSGTVTGDDARRAVLKDIGEKIIVPALRDFEAQAANLKSKIDALVLAPGDAGARTQARDAWRSAMVSWQRNEVLQVGPGGRSSGDQMTAGGENFRDFIYSWPVALNRCGIESAADAGDAVTGNSPINTTGLGAVEYLLFADAAQAGCAQQPDAAKRMTHAKRITDRIATLSTTLRNRWEVTGNNFISQWSNAGTTSTIYGSPQDALNALSVALYYTEKETKDLKIANPIGIGATGLPPCTTVSCAERSESGLSMTSAQNIRANLQALQAVLNGVDGKGLNDLLTGIGRGDIASKLNQQLDATITHLNTINPSFESAVASIASRTDCTNASASRSGEPACALHGFIKLSEDTYTTEVVGALSLARPDRAAGDND